MGVDIFHLICQAADTKVLVSLFGFFAIFCFELLKFRYLSMEVYLQFKRAVYRVDKLYLNKLYCITSQRAMQARAPKAVAEQAGSQIHFSSEFPS